MMDETTGTASGTDPETGEEIGDESEEAAVRRKARANAADGADAAHGGGLGASGSAVDFGKPANYAGIDDEGL